MDDGSPDNRAEVVARYPGVRYVRQDNQGIAKARNAGFRESPGEFIVFLDADDRLTPDAVSAQIACFDAQSLSMLARYRPPAEIRYVRLHELL